MSLFAAVRPRALPQSERRRQAILEAVLRVIADGGVDAVTHRRVAAEAGVPLGSTTYYFASRDDLVRDAFRHYAAGVFASLAAIGGEIPIATVGVVVDFLVELARREFSDPSLLRVEYEFILRATRDEALAREFNAYESALVARLAEALERLGATHAMEAARAVIDLFRGFELERFTRPGLDVEDVRPRLALLIGALTGAAIDAPETPAEARRAATDTAGDPTAATTTEPRRISDGDRASSGIHQRGGGRGRARA